MRIRDSGIARDQRDRRRGMDASIVTSVRIAMRIAAHLEQRGIRTVRKRLGAERLAGRVIAFRHRIGCHRRMSGTTRWRRFMIGIQGIQVRARPCRLRVQDQGHGQNGSQLLQQSEACSTHCGAGFCREIEGIRCGETRQTAGKRRSPRQDGVLNFTEAQPLLPCVPDDLTGVTIWKAG